MRLAILLLYVLAGGATAAGMPFVAISDVPLALGDTCENASGPRSVPVDVIVPSSGSYRVEVAFAAMPMGSDMMMMDMMMTGGADTLVTVYASPVVNGPVVDVAAPLPIGSPAAWFAGSRVPPGTELVVTITAYTGRNGTGTIASTTSARWNCSSGHVRSVQNMGNASGALPNVTKAVAVEFVHGGLGHYFVTTSADEIAALERGTTPGWARTGQTFNVFASATADTSDVCRFYIPPELGNSHFYSASAHECEAVRMQYPSFTYEASSVFRVLMPDAATGACPALTMPVYRLWNGRADSNHRYTTDRATKARMVEQGFIAEGYGPDAVSMCAPI